MKGQFRAFSFVQTDLGLHFQFTESLGIVEYIHRPR